MKSAGYLMVGIVLISRVLLAEPVFAASSHGASDSEHAMDFPTHLERHLLNHYPISFLDEGFVPQGIAWRSEPPMFLQSFFSTQSEGSRVVTVNMDGTVLQVLSLNNPDVSSHHGHVGGIAISKKHLWIASSGTVYRYPLTAIDSASEKDDLDPDWHFTPDSRASHVTVFEDWLWVGEFARYQSGRRRYETQPHHHLLDRRGLRKYAMVAGYQFDPISGNLHSRIEDNDGRLRPDRLLSIRQMVQGISFEAVNKSSDVAWVVLSTSFGNHDSRLASYQVDFSNPDTMLHTTVNEWDPVPVWFCDGENHQKTVIIPKGAEQVVFTAHGLAVVFEAAAPRFNHWTGYRENRVLLFAPSMLLPESSP
jgi:hypothetical protein